MHAKTVGRLSGIFGLAVAFVAVNATAPLAVSPAKATQAPQNLSVPFDQHPQRAAQAHFDQFFAFALSPAAAHALPRVQVAINDAVFWVEPHSAEAGVYSGVLADQTDQAAAHTITFTKEDVQDWTFIGRNRKMYGSFQTRAQLSLLSPQNVEQVVQVLSQTVTPLGW